MKKQNPIRAKIINALNSYHNLNDKEYPINNLYYRKQNNNIDTHKMIRKSFEIYNCFYDDKNQYVKLFIYKKGESPLL